MMLLLVVRDVGTVVVAAVALDMCSTPEHDCEADVGGGVVAVAAETCHPWLDAVFASSHETEHC